MDIRETICEMDLYVKALEEFIKSNLPGSRERSLALTKLEECMMWAVNAASTHGVNDGNQEA